MATHPYPGPRRPAPSRARRVRAGALSVLATALLGLGTACALPDALRPAGLAASAGAQSAAAPADDWASATAVFTDSEGKQTTSPAGSVHYCSNTVGDSITLSERQTVPFQQVARIEVTRADALYTTDGKAELAVTLLSGQRLTGTVSSNCDFTGAGTPDRVSFYPQKLRSIEFRRTGGGTGTGGPGSAGTGPGGSSPSPASSAPSSGSWESATAVFTDSEGKQTTVPATSVHYCSNVVGDSITLSGSQQVPFERVRRIEVTRADALYTTDGQAVLAVTLLTGQSLTGTVSSNCDFTGATEIGRYSLYPQKLRSIEFRR